MSRNDYAIELVCREEIKAIGKPSTSEEKKTIDTLKRILKNVKNGEDIADEDWEVYEQAREDVMSALTEV